MPQKGLDRFLTSLTSLGSSNFHHLGAVDCENGLVHNQ
jgi:hypothetical protein